MSSASAAPEAGAAPAKGGKKKLLIIIGAVVLVLVLGGGAAAFMLMKNKAAAEAAAEGEDGEGAKPAKKAEAKGHGAGPRDPKHAPTFVPLDPFTVNLADRDAERYCQVGISLELADPKHGDTIKAYMPVIRNNILLLLAHKTAVELMQRGGKEKLARQIQIETARALGIEVDDEEDEEEAPNPPPKKKKKKKAAPAELPVAAVHFSNFIIQ